MVLAFSVISLILEQRLLGVEGNGLWLKLFQVKDTWWWNDGGTEGRNLDRMSTISFLFFLKQIGFMRKKLEGSCYFTYCFPLVDFGSSALSDDTKSLPIPPAPHHLVKGKEWGLKETAVLCSWLVDLGKVLTTSGPQEIEGLVPATILMQVWRMNRSLQSTLIE